MIEILDKHRVDLDVENEKIKQNNIFWELLVKKIINDFQLEVVNKIICTTLEIAINEGINVYIFSTVFWHIREFIKSNVRIIVGLLLRNKRHFVSKILPTLGVSHELLVYFVRNLLIVIRLNVAFPVSQIESIARTGQVLQS